jgi:hypothetical protein
MRSNDDQKRPNNGDMNGYQIYCHYCEYHDRGSFFTHPSIAIAEDYYIHASKYWSKQNPNATVRSLLVLAYSSN